MLEIWGESQVYCLNSSHGVLYPLMGWAVPEVQKDSRDRCRVLTRTYILVRASVASAHCFPTVNYIISSIRIWHRLQ